MTGKLLCSALSLTTNNYTMYASSYLLLSNELVFVIEYFLEVLISVTGGVSIVLSLYKVRV